MGYRRSGDDEEGDGLAEFLFVAFRHPFVGIVLTGAFALAGRMLALVAHSPVAGPLGGEILGTLFYVLAACTGAMAAAGLVWRVATSPVHLMKGLARLLRFPSGRDRTARTSTHDDGPPTTTPVAPRCPRCDVQMVRRTARRGPRPGQPFWGCRNYPLCRQIVDC